MRRPLGSTPIEVCDAAGHTNVSITSGYLHVAVDDGDTVGNLFGQRMLDLTGLGCDYHGQLSN